MPRALDTDARADEAQIEALRNMGPAARLQRTFELSAAAWTMARYAYDRLYAQEPCSKRDIRFLSSLYGSELACKCVEQRMASQNYNDVGKCMTPVSPNEFFSATRMVIDAFDKIGVAYEIGGSVASSLHGVYRTTADVDIVADLPITKVEEFIRQLGFDFYADDDAIRSAVREKRSFNAIYKPFGLKIDVFALKNTPFARAEFKRRIQMPFPPPNGPLTWISSAEDIILHKLLWYKSGGAVSTRQWNDAIGVLRVNAGHLDENYLVRWAETLGVSELLKRANEEAAESTP
jgi:hypothetical protein